MRNELRAEIHIAKYGRLESGCTPWLAAFVNAPVQVAHGSVSIGKKTVGRAARTPV